MSTPPPDLGVVVSPAKMYEEVRRIGDGLIRLESKLDALAADRTDVDTRLADHEARLRHLEANRWPLPTISAVGAIIAVVASVAPLIH
ncbi:hypothetical protein [Kitasatospora sp. NPDC056731]|uniref:hypothetical protein n=1 Tax=Kitasatospora sp. NPDC056731 TaxID=3155422 RepID=UPI00343D45B9